jgi:phosphatidylinositol alpha-mannosyltransferase
MVDAASESGLKIAYLFDGHFEPAQGVPAYVDELGTYMQRAGHEAVYLVGSSEQSAEHIQTIGRTVTLHANGNDVPISLPITNTTARELVKVTQPDVMHLQMPHNPFATGRFVKQASPDVPLVATFHVLPFSRVAEVGMRIMARATTRSSRRIDHMISNSTATQNFVKEAYGMDSTLIPCPVDVSELSKGKKLEKYDDGKTNIVFLGRLVERKGAQHLISALGTLGQSEKNNIRLLIAGKGGLEAELRKLVTEKGLDVQTEFLGFVPDEQKADLMATADLAVFPATGGESFGIVLVEAMAAKAGVVIGGDNPGYRSVMSDTPELVLDPTNEIVFAAKLKDLIRDKDARLKFHQIQQRAVRQFDIATVGAEIEEIYRSVLADT